jgi:alpha-galactosidase
MIPRRRFLTAIGLGSALPAALAQPGARPSELARCDVLRPPDAVSLQTAAGYTALQRAGNRWQTAGVEVTAEPRRAGDSWEVPVAVSAPGAELEHIHLRWHGAMSQRWRVLGDHWERSYGDLEWRGSVPDRTMPWYFLITDGSAAHGYGVKTGASALCFWQADPAGVSLWLDVRNGGAGVRLGERRLEAAVVVATRAETGRTPFQTARALCRAMCERPRLAAAPIYGGNNWYYTYGENFSAADVLRDADTLSDAAPAGEPNRPFMVIDMGWSPNAEGAGPNNRGNQRFPDMPGLAAKMRARGARPGIWIRPLLTVDRVSDSWRLPANRLSGAVKPPFAVLDPSVPEALQYVRESVSGVRKWGYELIKHDYSTYDLLGRWGFQMGVQLTNPGWHFADRSRTSAEIVLAFYRALREAAGDGLLLGCNTIGHLGAGIFEAQRIGDDTSGREWERTRKMGVNTLAFRLPQHNTFFAADPDCVPVTPQVPWQMTRQWLDLVARSGTPLFVSADPASFGAEQKSALKAAFAYACKAQGDAEPLDWMETTAPEHWKLGGKSATYEWYGGEGVSPFAS